MALRKPLTDGEGNPKRPSGNCPKCIDGWVQVWILWTRTANGNKRERLSKSQYEALLGEIPPDQYRTVTRLDGSEKRFMVGEPKPRISKLDPLTQRVYEAVEACGCEEGKFMDATVNKYARENFIEDYGGAA